MKQRAQQIIAMSKMSQGMTDPPKTPNGDDISSMTDEEILSSFLKYFGQRVGIGMINLNTAYVFVWLLTLLQQSMLRVLRIY